MQEPLLARLRGLQLARRGQAPVSPKLSGQYMARSRPSTWRDPIRAGWPGPMKTWTDKQWAVFNQHYHGALAVGERDCVAWSEAYGAVTRMPAGRRRD